MLDTVFAAPAARPSVSLASVKLLMRVERPGYYDREEFDLELSLNQDQGCKDGGVLANLVIPVGRTARNTKIR